MVRTTTAEPFITDERPFNRVPGAELAGPELAVVVPTFRERENVAILVTQLADKLADISWEVIFVDDDSPDGTAEVVRQIAQRDRRVRIVKRIGRRGLSSAVVEGILSSSSPFIAVMDADLQHDERLLPIMLGALKNGDASIAVGSRYVPDGSVGTWDKKRQMISRIATRLSHLVLKADLNDPMSGFFMLTRESFEKSLGRLSIQGYKILLDIISSSSEPVGIREIPYTFRERRYGESKLDSLVALEYATLLLDKALGGRIPIRFIIFSLIGGLGLFVHMTVLGVAMNTSSMQFTLAQTLATFVAMTFNFYLNNTLTYRDRRLIGARAVLQGMVSFYAVCSIGAVANIGIASVLFSQNRSWWIAGIAGVLVGAVWNYAASSFFTWRTR